jgi:hypothetical protein
MNNKYNDLRKINIWARIYWIFLILAVISVIVITTSSLANEIVAYNINPGNMNKSTEVQQLEIEKIVTDQYNSGKMLPVIIASTIISISALGIAITTLVSVVQIVSFNSRYNDPKYRSMLFSMLLILTAVFIPIFYLIVSINTRKSVIELEKDMPANL